MVARLLLSTPPQVDRMLADNLQSTSSLSKSIGGRIALVEDHRDDAVMLVKRPELLSSVKQTQSRSSSSYRRRRVHFATDENGDDDDDDSIQTSVYVYKAVSDKRKHRYFTTKSELVEMMESANEYATKYAQSNPTWLENVESLLLETPLSGGTFNQHETIETLCACEARGFEFCSPLLQKQQNWAVQSVLRRYKQLRSQQDPDIERRLRDKCEQVNRFSRELAKKLAQGDANVARTNYENDPTLDLWLHGSRTMSEGNQ